MAQFKIAITGLGYVGLPLAVEFARKYPVVGFDINKRRLTELRTGIDYTREIEQKRLEAVLKNANDCANGLFLSDQLMALEGANFYIVTVPTPVDKHNRPDLTALLRASETVGKVLKHNDIVVYESTVYPGVTEEECVPVLERVSGMQLNKDFFVGYSPERINPGDKEHTLTRVRKVIAGSTPRSAAIINDVYASIIEAGTHVAPSIRVAEAAKVIENTQRDINIAFINELSKIFNHLNIDTSEVLEAASTKWNFLQFKPGLVGGHCIGVDPYYLAQKALEVGYHPEMILAGRRLNDSMGAYVAGEVIRLMIKKGIQVSGSKALILGITFKENCPDVRNTRVVDIIRYLQKYGMETDVYDPWADHEEVAGEYGVHTLKEMPGKNGYSAVVITVAHRQFDNTLVRKVCSGDCVVYDVKAVLDKELVDARL